MGTRSVEGRSGVAAEILTYNAMATLPDVIAGVESQTLPPDRILIVDNASTDGTAEYIQSLPDRFEKLLLEENNGVGAGHNAAWKAVLEHGDCEFVWTLENDSIPPPKCLELLIGTAAKLEAAGTSFGCVRPRQVGEGHPETGSPEREPLRRETMTFNGALLKMDAITKAGWIREDLFMDQEDREYSTRLNSAGLSIYRDPTATIIHLGKGSNRPGPPSVLRTYYRVRNETYLRVEDGDWSDKLSSLARAVVATVRTLAVEDSKWRRIRARWRGTVDGLTGNLGRKSYPFLEEPRR